MGAKQKQKEQSTFSREREQTDCVRVFYFSSVLNAE